MNIRDLRIWKETGMTAIMVTHDVDEARCGHPDRDASPARWISPARARSSEDFLHYRAEILRQLLLKDTIFKIILKNARSLLLFLLYAFSLNMQDEKTI